MAGTCALSFSDAVSTNCCLSWSDESKIALCTDNRIYVMELQNNPYQFDSTSHFHHSCVQPHPSSNLLIKNFNEETFIKKLNYDEVHELKLDRTICPRDDCATSYRGYRCADWSPLGGDIFGRCLLACLSHDHRLTLQCAGSNPSKWQVVVELSSIYSEKNQKDYANFQELKFLSYKLAAEALSWSPVFEEYTDDSNKVKFTLLAVGMKNGDVIIWKINFPCRNQSDCKVVQVIPIESEIPTSLSFCKSLGETNKALLAVGFLSGTVHLISMDIGEEITCRPSCIYVDEDLMSVACMDWVELPQGDVCFVFCKEQYVLTCVLRREAGKLQMPSSSHVQANQVGTWLSATGLCSRKGYTVMASADGLVQELSIQATGKEVSLKAKPLTMEKESAYTWKSHGVVLSPNAIFFVTAMSPSSSYDHLSVRNPLKVQFSLLNVLDTISLEKTLYQNTDKIHCMGDILEGYRLCLFAESNIIELLCQHRLHITAHSADEDMSTLQMHRYKILVMKQFFPVNPLSTGEASIPVDKDLERLTDSLMKCHIQDCFRHVLKISTKKISFTKKGLCCYSLLPCQEMLYRKCRVCSELALPLSYLEDTQVFPDTLSRCTLCQGQLV
ncbi:general transcription factor 3C polypeptide 4-like isoform X2 [Gigantopelta aegis]|uniref:general transcription factor 3C polypeptide 4-like isoform X2 n=1 Tax=Gigantopelta aegis TaxID=1735272 RepID=UPI001B889BEB|nr:general transcription factor 3C polypeptide 4-like isoform X2 [Gigantopelta aegis]